MAATWRGALALAGALVLALAGPGCGASHRSSSSSNGGSSGTATHASAGASGSGSSGSGAGGSSGGTGGVAATAGASGNGASGAAGAGGSAGSSGAAGAAGSAGGCQPSTCATAGKNCGVVPDGCGALLDCGSCSGDAICGLQSANVCTSPTALCLPRPYADACSGKQCGLEGDGCGGTYSCGTCPQSEVCGASAPFQCGTLPVVSDLDCPARIDSCAEAGAECGPIGNGCGGTLDCGSCMAQEVCGISAPQLCGSLPVCQPLSAGVACAGKCGLVSNGCGSEVAGGVIDCNTDFPCPPGQSCGGGGVPHQCGSGLTCPLISSIQACDGLECGAAADGCGGSYDCGSCAGNEVCVLGLCEAPGCTAESFATACAGKQCGQVGDGCGGVIDCGGCAPGEQCGLRQAFQCDGCVPATASEACVGKECGLVYDGCGTQPENTFDCAVVNGGGACPSGELCGVLAPFQCDPLDTGSCVPTASTCAGLGWACGLAVDSCGGVHDCAIEGRSCSAQETCVGGISGPTECVTASATGDCPLCGAVPDCTSQPQRTRLTGRVITPGRSDGNVENQLGIPNAFVYILRADDVAQLPGMASGFPSNGTSCDRCTDQDLGPVLVSSVTDSNGEFLLEGNVPVGAQFVLAVKAGKFRRAIQLTLPPSAACQTTALPWTMPDNPTRLPRTTSDGLGVNIPSIAISTGAVDAIECVLEKMGVAASQFTRPQLGGPIHLYRANGAWPDQQSFDCNACPLGGSAAANDCRLAKCGGSSAAARTSFLQAVSDTSLLGSVSVLSAHDIAVFDCEGLGWDDTFAQRDAYGANVREYVNRGGRMFASHFGFTWLSGNGTQAYSAGNPLGTGLDAAAVWDTNTYTDLTGTGVVSVVGGRTQASPRVGLFASWMVQHGVTSAPDYTFPITEPRSLASGLGPVTEEFVYRAPDNPPQADPPGYDRRVQQLSFTTPYGAPNGESCGRVSYSGFHVASTSGIASPFQDAVFPAHCRDSLANGGNLTEQEKVLLFMLFDLATCVGSAPLPPVCTPRSCPGDGSCGSLPDGCGGVISCGCTEGAECIERQCAAPPCVPTTCEAEGVTCASISDGCGGTLACSCPTCAPVSQATACAAVSCGYASDGCSDVYFCSECPPDCVPNTACPSDESCGTLSDGCDGTLDCGDCPAGSVCGGREPNTCAAASCTPLGCDDVGAVCGSIGDGCGGVVQCGDCSAGQLCTRVDGVSNQCLGCQPLGCADLGAECGFAGDGCGAVLDCGSCQAGAVCGAEQPNRCGSLAACTPLGCAELAADCGLAGDGCGGVVDCGTCPPGEGCGIQLPFECDPLPSCEPGTCASLGAECGIASSGCSGVVDCGPCPGGSSCGSVEPNRCGPASAG